MEGAAKDRSQRTLKKEVFLTGKGLFTGAKVSLRLIPSPEYSGIVFCRKDLPHLPSLPALLPFVKKTPRCTSLMYKTGESIVMVEHLLSAIKAHGIDNLRIEVDGPEIPVGDGSADPFVEMIEKSGIAFQKAPKKRGVLQKPLYWSQQDTHLIALPDTEFRVSCTLHYPQSPFIRSQYYSLVITSDSFKKEIAMCRTFSLYEDIAAMLEKGLLKGGGLENGVVIKDHAVMNPEGLRCADEMVRHKILDLVGDLSLIGMDFSAHIIAIRSGHAANVTFAELLADCLQQIYTENDSRIGISV